jgi:toxin HigB-1
VSTPPTASSQEAKALWPLTSDNYYFTVVLKVIRSFKHRGLKRLYERDDRSGIRPDLLETVERILTVLDSATTPQALDLPRYRLHPLKGDLKGLWSVTVRANWRIVFRFEGEDAFDVELIDYH